jgi:hypothetical protein
MREYEAYVLDTQAHMLRDAVVGADRTHARVCKGLEDQSEPLCESGPGDGLAR